MAVRCSGGLRTSKSELKRARRYGRLALAAAACGACGAFLVYRVIFPPPTAGTFAAVEAAADLDDGGAGLWRRLSAASVSCETMGAGEAVGLFLVTLYIFLGLAVICDEWFVPSLEKISSNLNLSADVAGATFLAAGSSAPELFTSVADTFGPGNSIGIGTIVGSAMFNILIIVAMSAAATTKTLDIDWRPVVRDVCFYTASIGLLALFFQDERIEWWESLIMVLGYVLYITFMAFNERIFSRCRSSAVVPLDGSPAVGADAAGQDDDRPAEPEVAKKPQPEPVKTAEDDGNSSPQPPVSVSESDEYEVGKRTSLTYHKGLFQGKAPERVVVLPDGTKSKISQVEGRGSSCSVGAGLDTVVPSEGTAQPSEGAAAPVSGGEEEEEGYLARFNFPMEDPIKDKILWVLSLPYYVMFTFTVPDCSKAVCERWYVATFMMSIGWIAALCSSMVLACTYIGCIVEIGPFVMGNLVLAIGTSVPDALGSMIVARAGEADMAIANAVGSNVFDILLGLGFPWFVKTMATGEPVIVTKCGVDLAVIILFSTVFVYFGVLMLNRWKMNHRLGVSFLVAYGVYFLYTLLSAKEVLPTVECAS